METFPTYATIRLAGYAEQLEPGVIVSDMETGPPKLFKSKSRVMLGRRAAIQVFGRANYLAFLAWFGTSLNRGADWFTLADRVRGVNVTARFRRGEIGEVSLSGTVDDGVYLFSAVLESWEA